MFDVNFHHFPQHDCQLFSFFCGPQGERLRLPGYTEISAVCTRAEYRGRGYARALVHSLATRIIARNEIPFLHVELENTNAIRVYEGLGFRERRRLQLIVLQSASD